MLSNQTIKQKQTNNIVFITFWSQFSVYAFNTVLILFLTRPTLINGLGYSQEKAYAFFGVTQAMGYLMPVAGGYMADVVVGVRRSILIGSILLALAYLLIMISGYTLNWAHDYLFIAAYALLPASNSLLMGTASSMVSHIHSDDARQAKKAMTYYYMAINIGALLAACVAPSLLDSPFGPLSVLTISFIGKSIAALNFAKRYALYDSAIWGKDTRSFSSNNTIQLIFYLGAIYALTLFAYTHIAIGSLIIISGCIIGITWFTIRTVSMRGSAQNKQLVALLLIIEAILFFIIYNQMHTTLVLFAEANSNHTLLGFTVSPAQYQMLNPLLIIAIGSQLPKIYDRYQQFTIPYQFAAGTMLSGIALLLMTYAASTALHGIVNGNYIAITYILITIGELWVSAIGLSMIGLYCDSNSIAFAMGIWYLAGSMSHAISGKIASWVAIPQTIKDPLVSIVWFKNYYFFMGLIALGAGVLMGVLAYYLQKRLHKKGIQLH